MSTIMPEDKIDEEETTEAPLTMAASLILTSLPRDASRALESAGLVGVPEKGEFVSSLSFFFLSFSV
jgi:hypothetical protein